MRRTIPLSELVISDDFLEGSSLFHKKAVMLLSQNEAEGVLTVQGSVKNVNRSSIMVKCDHEGKIINKSCSEKCGGICRHVIALALLFNELSVDDADPLDQLSDLKVSGEIADTKFPCEVAMDRNGDIKLLHDRNDMQLNSLTGGSPEKIICLISVFPEMFTINGKKLKKAVEQLNLFYKTEGGKIEFHFSDHIKYFENEGVVLNLENGNIWRFSKKMNETLLTLIRISIEYEEKDELVKAIADLCDNLKPGIVLTGELNINKIELDDETETVFEISFNRGRIYVEIFFEKDGDSIPFKPRRKNFDQNYPINGKVYALSPVLIKNIRSALSSSGFRLSGNRYQTSTTALSGIIEDDSPLNTVGRIVSKTEIKKVTFQPDVADRSEIAIDINNDEKWFSFSIKLPESSNYIDSRELLDAVNQFRKGVFEPVVSDVSSNPVIIAQSREFLNKISEMMSFDDDLMRERISNAHILKLLKSKNKKNIRGFVGSSADRKRYMDIIESLSADKMPKLRKNAVLNKKMRSYQLDGYRWFSMLKDLGLGGVLADEMGLGKTIQSLTMIKNEPDDRPSLVICPKTLVWSWDREIEKFYPEMKRIIIDSMKPSERTAKWEKIGNQLVITSYAVVINDFPLIKDVEFRTVIVDEAQHIKNNNTKRFKTLSSIRSVNKFALTGTPLENHISDLWSIFEFIMPGFLGKKKDVERMEKTDDIEGMKKLSRQTSPFILRRTKKEILKELPELIVKEYPVNMTAKQKEIYLSVLLRGRAEYLEHGEEMNKIQILSILSRLRQAANHPGLAVNNVDMNPEHSGKVATVLELLDEITQSGGKALVFSQYVGMLKIIEEALISSRIAYHYMDGQTVNRKDVVSSFNNGDIPVFLLSLKVGGVGLNLTGADNVIIVDPWWNPAAEEQAWSRAHRIGQEKKVVVNKLFSRGTIEEKILDMHEKKRGMTDFFLSKSLKNPNDDFLKMIADMELSVDD